MKWSHERLLEWHGRQPWVCGFNYVPSSAVNSTEMWQRDSFDLSTVARELRWARDFGFNGCRVFVQYLVWESEREALLDRFEQFLSVAADNGILVTPVLFDDCAFSGKQPYLGPQAAPAPGVHNSGWTPSPGHARAADPSVWPLLEAYVTAFITRLGRDERVWVWDVYNEPGNGGMGDASLPLLRAAFDWARRAAPSQPLTAGMWNHDLTSLNATSLELSDIVSFHHYGDLDSLRSEVDGLHGQAPGPLLCTEWMARTLGSRFATHLPFFNQGRIGCFSWGLVRGKTQTHIPWNWRGEAEPPEWFHDVLHPDGTPYCESEANMLSAGSCLRPVSGGAATESAGSIRRR